MFIIPLSPLLHRTGLLFLHSSARSASISWNAVYSACLGIEYRAREFMNAQAKDKSIVK